MLTPLELEDRHGALSAQRVCRWVTTACSAIITPVEQEADEADGHHRDHDPGERLRSVPFWNSSQTNLPRPGFCASISAAISTIQPTPSDRRMPVKISGSAEGRTSLVTLGQVEQLQHPADVDQVLVDRGDADARC